MESCLTCKMLRKGEEKEEVKEQSTEQYEQSTEFVGVSRLTLRQSTDSKKCYLLERRGPKPVD